MVLENTVTFKAISDKTILAVTDTESGKPVAEITGYDIQVKFNMEIINSQSDIDEAAAGIADIFKEMLINQMLGKSG